MGAHDISRTNVLVPNYATLDLEADELHSDYSLEFQCERNIASA